MTSTPASESRTTNRIKLVRCARFPAMRALAWSNDHLYASRGYELFRASVQDASSLTWSPVARFHPSSVRRLSAGHRLSARLLRDGFHALTIAPSGGLVAAVPAAIIAVRPGETEFRITHSITRGTRPLHITAAPSGAIFWGEYFDNPTREEVHICASTDSGLTWSVAYTFPKRAIRHVHNIVHDPWADCLWILTGDYGNECRILRAACDLSHVETVLQGKQQARAVAAIPTKDGLYFSSDTPLEQNYIYRLDRQGALSQLVAVSSSSIYGCHAKEHLFFSTMIEPSEVNRDRAVRIYGAPIDHPDEWHSLINWKKDRWPMRFFQYGNAFLPDGTNTTPYLAVTTVAVESDDMATLLYSVES